MTALTDIRMHQLIEQVEKSGKISDELKTYYKTLIQRSAEATNGVSQQEKIQACSEISFALLGLVLQDKLSDNKASKTQAILECVEKCKTQLCVLGLGLCALLCFHPELAQLVKSFIK